MTLTFVPHPGENAMRMRGTFGGVRHFSAAFFFLENRCMDAKRYVGGFDRCKTPIMLRCPPEIHVIPLCPPEECLKVYVHFLQGYSLPCTGDGCKNCKFKAVPYGYCPVIHSWRKTREGYQASYGILPVTFAAFDFFARDRRTHVISVNRSGGRKHGRMVWAHLGEIRDHGYASFDVESCLQRLWLLRESESANGATGTQLESPGSGATVLKIA